MHYHLILILVLNVTYFLQEVVVASSNLQHQQPPSVVIPQAKSTTTIASPNLISSSVHRIIPVTQISATGTLPASRSKYRSLLC